MRAPDMPGKCPQAGAPPFTLIRAKGTPSVLAASAATPADSSWISKMDLEKREIRHTERAAAPPSAAHRARRRSKPGSAHRRAVSADRPRTGHRVP
ncbi:hypothetical protein GCM10010390_26920 [Streptomyces mordarskii]|uniref:Uncharacterized protein n=1 Tax=Streptomyces mordarskii TaxID=1226758 RepID=A0ABN1CPI2_9ACTN